jgi:hypothetical protein
MFSPITRRIGFTILRLLWTRPMLRRATLQAGKYAMQREIFKRGRLSREVIIKT